MDLGKRFKHFREKTGMTQGQAAAKIGVKNYQLGNYETNRSEPNIATLKKMSVLYGVTIDKLVGLNRQSEESEKKADAGIDLEALVNKLNEVAQELSAFAIEGAE